MYNGEIHFYAQCWKDGKLVSAWIDCLPVPVTPMNCPYCDGIAPRGELEHALDCPERR